MFDKSNQASADIAALNRNMNTANLFGIERASTNGWCTNALLIDLNNPLGETNETCIIDGNSTINIPADLAWGVREVLYVSQNGVIVRITGIKKDGYTNVIWTNIYNTGSWRGWIEH